MASDAERLERLIADEMGECCEGAVDERVDTLTEYASDVPENTDRDRAALQTLADDTRHRIVRLLATADRDLCVCELNPMVDVSDSAVSHALSDLHDAGLVTRRKDGNWRYYGTTERADALLDALDATRGDD
jgi:ArsR family transcriptional regulator